MADSSTAPNRLTSDPQFLDARTLGLLDQVRNTAGSVGVASELPRHYLEIVARFDRLRSTFAASVMLVSRGFVHEAVSLGRGMFTDSLTLAEFAAADDKQRVALAIGWELHGLADFEGILKQGEANGDAVSEELALVAERRSALHAYAQRHDVRARAWQPAEKPLADKHGRHIEYMDFRLTHHFVHGSAIATGQRYRRHGDTVVIGGPGVDLATWAVPAALFAAFSLLHGVRAICAVLHLEPPAELETLLTHLEDAAASAGPDLEHNEQA